MEDYSANHELITGYLKKSLICNPLEVVWSRNETQFEGMSVVPRASS